jgi:hypothetical protein
MDGITGLPLASFHSAAKAIDTTSTCATRLPPLLAAMRRRIAWSVFTPPLMNVTDATLLPPLGRRSLAFPDAGR